jgi:DNA-binding winged helix-turn-helix (wHTH) protein
MKEFPPFRLDPVNQRLWRRGDAQDDERILLMPKAFAVLRYLVEHLDRLVSQDELLGAVWPCISSAQNANTEIPTQVRASCSEMSHSASFSNAQSRSRS